MGAVTERIRFVVSVLKLTVRHPVLVAKQAASTAVLTGDRLTLGIGTSPWPEDYEVTGVPFERRGKRADECIAVMRGLLTGNWFEPPRRDLRRAPHQAVPGPGHPDPDHRRRPSRARPAPSRAQRRLDPRRRRPGRAPRPHRPAPRLRAEAGRTADPVEVHVISMDAYTVDSIRRLEELGVTDVVVGFRWTYDRAQDTEPLQQKVDNLKRYAETVIAATR